MLAVAKYPIFFWTWRQIGVLLGATAVHVHGEVHRIFQGTSTHGPALVSWVVGVFLMMMRERHDA